MWQTIEISGETTRYELSHINLHCLQKHLIAFGQRFSRSMITKTGVYKQKIQSSSNKFKDIYIFMHKRAFMKLKEKVYMYSQHITRIQWSE